MRTIGRFLRYEIRTLCPLYTFGRGRSKKSMKHRSRQQKKLIPVSRIMFVLNQTKRGSSFDVKVAMVLKSPNDPIAAN